MNWLRHFVWFIKTSKSFLECSYFQMIMRGVLNKSIKHANYMVKYDKLTPEQKEHLYLTEDRTLEF